MSLAIDIWCWRLDGPIDAETLSPEERTRADSFVFPHHRARFIAGRTQMRTILASYLGTSPGAVAFRYGAFGRPEIDGLHFNLSHSDAIAALAVCHEAPLGVDIEQVKPIDLDVARAHFAPREYRSLLSLPSQERRAAFYRCWTRKEAYLKARGTGLSTDLASFEVSLRADELPRLKRCDSGEQSRWSLHDLDFAAGFTSALAVRSEGGAVRIRRRCVERC